MMIRIFVGFDGREAVAWHVLAHSLFKKTRAAVSITPIFIGALSGLLTRPRDPLQSTDFAFSRFLVPYLSGYEGWSLFMDCDMLLRADLTELWSMRDDQFSLMCVQHTHEPKENRKFLGAIQTRYEKKNWSSLMLFNNEKCRALTPDYVNSASGLELHQFKWLSGDSLIGALPKGWNHLVGYDEYDPSAKLVHFTLGGPYFEEYAACDYAEEWRSMLAEVLRVG